MGNGGRLLPALPAPAAKWQGPLLFAPWLAHREAAPLRAEQPPAPEACQRRRASRSSWAACSVQGRTVAPWAWVHSFWVESFIVNSAPRRDNQSDVLQQNGGLGPTAPGISRGGKEALKALRVT